MYCAVRYVLYCSTLWFTVSVVCGYLLIASDGCNITVSLNITASPLGLDVSPSCLRCTGGS